MCNQQCALDQFTLKGVAQAVSQTLPGQHFVRILFERRALIAELVRRDFQQRYVGSAAGWLWGVVHPLVLLGSWIFIFQICLKMTLPAGSLTQNYPLFLFGGILPWLLFQETVTRSAPSMVENANLITRTIFPSEVLPVSIFLSSMIHHLIAIALFAITSIVVLHRLSPMILLLPFYMLLLGMFSVGVAWILSSLHVYLRDTAQVLSVVMTLLFWFTPIMISERQIPQRFRPLLYWNPLSWFVRAYRERLLSDSWPDWQELVVMLAYSLAAFLLGGLFFRHLKRGFADVL